MLKITLTALRLRATQYKETDKIKEAKEQADKLKTSVSLLLPECPVSQPDLSADCQLAQ